MPLGIVSFDQNTLTTERRRSGRNLWRYSTLVLGCLNSKRCPSVCVSEFTACHSSLEQSSTYTRWQWIERLRRIRSNVVVRDHNVATISVDSHNITSTKRVLIYCCVCVFYSYSLGGAHQKKTSKERSEMRVSWTIELAKVVMPSRANPNTFFLTNAPPLEGC